MVTVAEYHTYINPGFYVRGEVRGEVRGVLDSSRIEKVSYISS